MKHFFMFYDIFKPTFFAIWYVECLATPNAIVKSVGTIWCLFDHLMTLHTGLQPPSVKIPSSTYLPAIFYLVKSLKNVFSLKPLPFWKKMAFNKVFGQKLKKISSCFKNMAAMSYSDFFHSFSPCCIVSKSKNGIGVCDLITFWLKCKPYSFKDNP